MTARTDVSTLQSSKSSPGYARGEKAAIAAWLAENEPTICPGFGSGQSIEMAPTLPPKNGMAKAAQRYLTKKKTQARELTLKVVALHSEDSGPGCNERIAAQLGISPETVKRKLLEAKRGRAE